MSTNSYTPDQKRAIEFFSIDSEKKHLVIEAGAGSGKTTILKERIRFLLSEKKFVPEDFVVITFTKNSTAELKHRISNISVDAALRDRLKFIHISTIDSFFASLVDSLYPLWWHTQCLSDKIPPPLQLLTEQQAVIELEKDFSHALEGFSPVEMSEIADFILSGGLEKNLNALNSNAPLEALLFAMLSDVFLATDLDHIRISSQYIHPATQKLIELSHDVARRGYQKRVLAGTFTYADRNVFLKENLHLGCPLFFKELIVDEYQDTNHIQHAILWKLVELNHAQMTVVGDPKQSIYAFRGSNVDVFQSLLSDKHWTVISLDVNFRSQAQLLDEVNVLSHLSFDWNTPNLPDAFQNSFFSHEARKKSIGHKPLKAGLKTVHPENESAPYQWKNDAKAPVILFEYDGITKTRTSSKRAFNENNIKSLGQYLIAQVERHYCDWKDIAILCEKNKQIAKIKQVFDELSIPCSTDLKKSRSRTDEFIHLIAKSLFNILYDNFSDSLDIFYLFMSPLVQFKYEDILCYFLNAKNHQDMRDCKNFEHFNNVLELLKEQHKHVTVQAFITWQKSRFELIKNISNPKSSREAYNFCIQMDDFAKNVFSVSELRSDANLKKILNELEIENTSKLALNDTENALSLKTVHGAKGLEWDVVCFYPAMSRHEGAETFSLSISWPYLDINWLSEDVKSLSFLQKKENQKFSEQDCIYHDEKEKYLWFSDLRNQLEKNFERQRIFYTAFTRPRKKLILLHPERQGANSARQIDKKFNFSNYDKNYEQDVFLKYAYLINANKVNAEHIRFLPDDSNDNIEGQSKSDSILTSTIDKNINIPTEPIENIENAEISLTKYNLVHEPPSMMIKQKQRQRRAAQRGLIFHTKSENMFFPDTSIQGLIHKNALKFWTEFEISNRKSSEQFQTERKIIDLFALFTRHSFESIFSELSRSCDYLHTFASNSSNYIFLILDFKTGAITDQGVSQISHYARLIDKLSSAGWFAPLVAQECPDIVGGLLQTSKAV